MPEWWFFVPKDLPVMRVFAIWIWKKRRRIRPLYVTEISQDLSHKMHYQIYFWQRDIIIVQALTEPIFIRSNAKLVALDASSFSLIVDTRNRHIIDEMDQILMSRYAHLLSKSGYRMPVLKRYWIWTYLEFCAMCRACLRRGKKRPGAWHNYVVPCTAEKTVPCAWGLDRRKNHIKCRNKRFLILVKGYI